MRQWEVKTICAIDEKLVEDLWFFGGELVAVDLRDNKVSVKKWDINCKSKDSPASQPVDLVGLSQLPSGTRQVLPRYSLRSSIVNTKAMPKAWFPYAVSPDGQRIAWALNGTLYVKEASSPVAKLNIGSQLDVIALSFSSGKTLTLIREDGTLEHWDALQKTKGAAGTRLSKNWSFWSQGPRLAVASLGSGDMGFINVKSANENEILLSPIGFKSGSAMTLSQKGLPAVGTRDGKIVTYVYDENQGFVSKRMLPLPEPRPVRSLVFFSDDLLIVGGEFRFVYIVGSDGQVNGDARSVMEARNGARILALNQKNLAISTPDEVIVGELDNPLRVTPQGALSLTFFSLAVSILSIGFNIIRDTRKS